MAAILSVLVLLVRGVHAARAQQGGVRVCSIGSAFACTQAHERTRNSGS